MAHGNNTIPIPGELRSEATEGVVASADAIKDYNKGKFQEQVNAEVDTKIQNIKGGSDKSIKTLSNEISSEATTRQNADTALGNRVSTLETAVGGGGSIDTRIANAVSAEKNRAEAAEATKANINDVYTKTQGTAFEGRINDTLNQKTAVIEAEQASQRQLITTEFADQDSKMDNMQATINAKQLEIGAVETDLEPTKNSPNRLTSGTLYDIYGHYEESPEFIKVELDEEDKVLEGMRNDGTKVIGGDLSVGGSAKILGNMEVLGVSYKVIENPEYLAAWVDTKDKVIFGLKADGNTYVADADFLNDIDNIKAFLQSITDKNIDWDALSSITTAENPEFIEAKTDSEGKVLAGRTPDGAAFENVGFSAPKVSIDGHIIEDIEDPEARTEIITDAKGKIISYRDSDGVKHEEVGIASDKLILSEDGLKSLQEDLNTVPVDKKWYLPKFGKVDIKEETFYLTADSRWSTKDDVVCIQMLDDTTTNASQRLSLSYYYIKSTLIPLPDGRYDRTSVTENSVKLDFYPAKEVVEDTGHYYVKKITKVNGNFYLTSSLEPIVIGSITTYRINRWVSVKLNVDLVAEEQETLTNAIEVTKVIDVPQYKAWPISKAPEHYCMADIDFGDYYKKDNVPVGIKYQGNSTILWRKKGFRITFYKKNDYKKKDKVKIGEMVKLSGYNMKSYFTSDSRIKDPIISNLSIEIWNSHGDRFYPWNKDTDMSNGANGLIESFPIETRIGNDNYGIQFFSVKKDEKNYMLDGDDDASGIFVSGDVHGDFGNTIASEWADEMGVEGRELAYPERSEDSVSVETAAAMNELFKYFKGFVDGEIEIDGQIVAFKNSMLEERIDIANFIDYWIVCQVFQLWDNVMHNCILYSAQDKKKFYIYFYDLDSAMEYEWDRDLLDICSNPSGELPIPTTFWEKFLDEYRDFVINRYASLRKNILSNKNIKDIYMDYISKVPTESIRNEVSIWGSGDLRNFEKICNNVILRLELLDKIYFNL